MHPRFIAARANVARRALVAGLLLAAAVPAAIADGTPAPWGTRMPSGSSVQTEIGPFDVKDCDDYVFEVVTGQTVTVTVKSLSKTFVPTAEMIRGSGVQVLASEGLKVKSKRTTRTLSFKADRTDTYKVRVRGTAPEGSDVPTTGPYSVSVKVGARPKGKVTNAVPDTGNQLRFPIPAIGGANVTTTLKFTGKAPILRELVEPTGNAITGYPSRAVVTSKSISVKNYVIDPTYAFGDYTLVYDTDPASPPTKVSLTYLVKPPKSEPARKGKIDKDEPFVVSVTPPAGGTNTLVTVNGGNFADEFKDGAFRVFVGRFEVKNVAPVNPATPTQLRGTVPGGIPYGVYDVRVETATGQSAVKANAFSVVAPPVATKIEPAVGPTDGGYPLTITGSGFRSGAMGITIDGALVPVSITSTTPTSITFTAPPRAPGFVTMGVKDRDTQLTDDLPVNSFEFTAGAAVQRLVPSLVPVLGTETVFVRGVNFDTITNPNVNLHVFVETSAEGVFEDVTPSGGAYLNNTTLSFTAPGRTKGVYDVYVRDVSQPNSPRSAIRTLSYYTFGDLTPALKLPLAGAEQYDAYTSTLADYDGDGDEDLFLSRVGAANALGATSHTRVLRNDGAAGLVDVTTGASAAMPAPTADDDWRADKIALANISGDSLPDLILCTNSAKYPALSKSHVRILVNEARGGTGAGATDRVFRDRTIDLMPPPRIIKKYNLFGGGGGEYFADSWRGLDMWVGDVDAGTTPQPEILITHDEEKDDSNITTDQFTSGVYCAPYCNTSGGYQISYTFYWGGSRAFVWDKNAAGGRGRYTFDYNFFPRKSGVFVPQVAPGGTQIKGCNPSNICKGKFPPYTGQRLAVAPIDDDTKPDVAVLSRTNVMQDGQTISALQVGLNRFDASSGSQLTTLTPTLAGFGDTRADTLAIGQPGYPDGTSAGVVATSKILGGSGGSVMRFFKYVAGVDGAPGTFSEITSAVLPAVTSTEKWQASAIEFRDIDGDGDQDLIMVANAPVGSGSGTRILRNVFVAQQTGIFDKSIQPLIENLVTPAEKFDGDCIAIGDFDNDDVLDFIISRATPPGAGSQTRAIQMQK